MEKPPPAPSISRGFLEHRGPGRILPGGPPALPGPPWGSAVCALASLHGVRIGVGTWRKRCSEHPIPTARSRTVFQAGGAAAKRAWAAPQSRQRGAGILPAKIREGKRSPG